MFLHKFSRDLAIDLGTSNTLVFVRGEGIAVNEPSIVSINEGDHSILAVGNEAKAMIGRTPPEIRVIQPLKNGVIADFEMTERMLSYFITRTQRRLRTVLKPQVVIGAALREPVTTIIETVRTCLERTPPELAADLVDSGIVITGGGSLLRGLDRLLIQETQLPVKVAPDPMACVVLGLGRMLDEVDLLKRVAGPA